MAWEWGNPSSSDSNGQETLQRPRGAYQKQRKAGEVNKIEADTNGHEGVDKTGAEHRARPRRQKRATAAERPGVPSNKGEKRTESRREGNTKRDPGKDLQRAECGGGSEGRPPGDSWKQRAAPGHDPVRKRAVPGGHTRAWEAGRGADRGSEGG